MRGDARMLCVFPAYRVHWVSAVLVCLRRPGRPVRVVLEQAERDRRAAATLPA